MDLGHVDLFPGLAVAVHAHVDPDQSTRDELVVVVSAGDLVAAPVGER